MKKIINGICVLLGFITFIFGMIGIVLPILPTTPFLLLSAALFMKGSERFHRWLLETSIYKKYIEQAVKKKEMTRKVKCKVLLTISCLFFIGFIMSPILYARIIIVMIAILHYYFFLFRIKTTKRIENQY